MPRTAQQNQQIRDATRSKLLDSAMTVFAEEGYAQASIRNIFDTLQTDPTFWSLFQGLRSQPAVMNVLADSIRLWTGRLREIFVDNLTQAGRANPEIEARLLYSLIEGTIQQYLLEPENYPLEEVVKRIIHQFGEVV